MTDVAKETELAVRLSEESGEMTAVIAAVSSASTRTLACCTHQDRDSVVMLMVTDDAQRTGEVLRAQGFRVTASEVVVVHAAYERQLAALLGRRLSATGIGILYSYVSWAEGHQAHLVFKTTDDDRAVCVLRAEMLVWNAAQGKVMAHERENMAPIAA